MDPSPGDPDGGMPDADGGGGGSDGGDEPDAPSPDAPAGGQVVFVTSNLYTGDLRTAGVGVDGLDGADKLCMLHAAAGSLPGTFRAWLSTSSIDAIDRITGPGPWKNLGDEIVFANRAQLQTHPVERVSYDEHGELAFPDVWTGTDLGREAALQYSFSTTATCNDWTSGIIDTDYSVWGDGGSATATWSKAGYWACSSMYALYCFAVL